MISTTSTSTPVTSTITTVGLENLTLISDSSSTTSATSTATSNETDKTIIDLQNAIRILESQITPLATKTQKKLNKIEDEIANANFLIDSGLGSKKDQAELRKTKRQLRQRRVKLWDELKILPTLKEEKIELERQVKALRRQVGIIDDVI